MKFIILISSIIFLSWVFAQETSISASSSTSTSGYLVQDGEHLSKIAYRYCRKVYGSRGFISFIRQVNPHLPENSDVLFPKTKIVIPSKDKCTLPWDDQRILADQKGDSGPDTHIERKLNSDDPQNIRTTEVASEKQESNLNNSKVVKDGFFGEIFSFFKFLNTDAIEDKSAPQFRISGVTLISQPVLGLAGGYRFNFNQKTIFEMKYSLHFEDYKDADSIEVVSSSRLRQNFLLAVSYQTWRLETGIEERTLVDESTYNKIQLSSGFSPFLKLKKEFIVFERSNQHIFLNPYGQYLISSQSHRIKVDPGYSAGVELVINRNSSAWIDQIKSGFRYVKQSTNVTSQTEQVVDFALIFDVE